MKYSEINTTSEPSTSRKIKGSKEPDITCRICFNSGPPQRSTFKGN